MTTAKEHREIGERWLEQAERRAAEDVFDHAAIMLASVHASYAALPDKQIR